MSAHSRLESLSLILIAPLRASSYVPVHLEYILTEILKNSFRASVEWHQRHHSYSSASPVPPVVITISSQPHVNDAPPPRSAATFPVSSLSHRPAQPPSHFLFLRVRDQGGGVPPANMSRIFSYSFTTAGRGAEDRGLHWDDEGMGGGPYAAQHMSGGGAIDGGGSESLFSEITGRGVQMGMGTIAGLGYGLPMSKLYAKYFGGSLDFKSLDGWGELRLSSPLDVHTDRPRRERRIYQTSLPRRWGGHRDLV